MATQNEPPKINNIHIYVDTSISHFTPVLLTKKIIKSESGGSGNDSLPYICSNYKIDANKIANRNYGKRIQIFFNLNKLHDIAIEQILN